MAKSTAKTPKPPENLDGESLLEWERVCKELRDIGKLDKACRASLVLYVQAWSVNQAAFRYVEQLGSVVRWPNKQPGPSPFYRVWDKSTGLCDRLLASLGLSPGARKVAPQSQEVTDLEF